MVGVIEKSAFFSGKSRYIIGVFKTPQTSAMVALQKMKFSIKDFFNKCDQVCRKLRIWSHLPKKFLMEKFIFCAVLTKHVTIIIFDSVLNTPR